MTKVTYLLGAGASAEALPTIKQMQDVIVSVMNSLQNEKKSNTEKNSESANPLIQEAINDLLILLAGCRNHLSVDTYAKMLFLTGRMAEYRRAKNLIILLFELYYYYYQSADKRYDAFLASILSSSAPRLPKNINVISWNYDYEFERAFSQYCKLDKALEEVYSELHVCHKSSVNAVRESDDFKLIKINGTTGYWDNTNGNNKDEIILGVSNFYYKKESDKVLNNERVNPTIHKFKYFSTTKEYTPAIAFAWETHTNNDIIQEAVKIMNSTEVLVVIGYSFPYFNREIDRLMLSARSAPNLKRVYVQDLKPENIIETIKGFRENNWTTSTLRMGNDFVTSQEVPFSFIPIKNLDQFYMPHEL